jgi:hypothetical protein
MAHAEICPVCKGSGKATPTIACHGCGGTGWVTVGYDSVPYYPSYPIYPTYPTPYYPWWAPNITYTYQIT